MFEGISFETPGQSAILLDSGAVTVLRCWFTGCIGAVRGGSDVTIEYCDYTHFPAHDDATEVLREMHVSPSSPGTHALVWCRKNRGHGCRTEDYEDGGLALRMKQNWEIHHNSIHDCFEGLSGSGMSQSVGAKIHDNVFARMCDNAIETEDHAKDAHIYRNLFLDALDTISYQPLSGPPWPGPIYFYENIIASSAEHARLWPYSNPIGTSAFKIGISVKNWAGGKHADVPRSPLAAPEPGVFFFNNTAYIPHGKIINPLGDPAVPVDRVFFTNNLFVADHLASMKDSPYVSEGHYRFSNNLVAAATQGQHGPGAIAAGQGGQTLDNLTAIGWRDPEHLDFSLRSGSPAHDRSVPVTGTGMSRLSDIGAIQSADRWYPLEVGPLAQPR